MNHCKDCAYFNSEYWLKPPYGECGAIGWCGDGGRALVFPLGDGVEGLAVHEDFGCVQFEPKE